MLNQILDKITAFFESFVMYPVLGIPFIVWWLGGGALFFTLRLGFVNIRLFGHAIKVLRGKYNDKSHHGEVSHFQALSSAVSGTVGLGNIAGVAVAISIGGVGAIFWMVLGGFLSMSSKFAEVTMGLKYRKTDSQGKISGGAFYYLSEGLAEKGLKTLGKVLAAIFAVTCICGAIGAGNMFQANQSVMAVVSAFHLSRVWTYILSILLAIITALVLIGGIKRVARVAEIISPFMCLLYVVSCFVILIVNHTNIIPAFVSIFHNAFALESATGGMVGALIAGVKRASFSNEAGLGSAPIAHATARTNEPVREGCVALLEPFIDTVIICFMTGLVLVATGNTSIGGVLAASNAFKTVAPRFDIVLSFVVFLFAYSTLLTWGYYGERAYGYLFGYKNLLPYHLVYIVCVVVGGVSAPQKIIALTEVMNLSMAIPNLLGLFILSKVISTDTKEYVKKYVK
jgi:alanine or glycine:cation symporter, AGCS family